jgi:dipeptidyl aminopeptidase/acylaminoacyl peptidase
VGPDSSPCYLAHSTGDSVIPVREAVDMADALAAAGVPYRFDQVSGAAHGIAMGKNATVLRHTRNWLKAYL